MNVIAWSQNMTPRAAEAAGAILVSKDEQLEEADSRQSEGTSGYYFRQRQRR
jgi:hypothetical protein